MEALGQPLARVAWADTGYWAEAGYVGNGGKVAFAVLRLWSRAIGE